MKYKSLNLEAIDYKKEGEVESFSVRVSESPVGAMTKKEAALVVLPTDLRPRVRRLENRKLSLEEMIKLGEDLAAALFPPRLRPLLEGNRARLAENEGLRIRLMLDAYELTDIPWEYVYLANPDTPVDQKGVEGFLVFKRRISILRDPLLEQPRGTVEPIPGQALRMVALLSNPKKTAELDLAREQQNIEKALKDLTQITAQFYPNATIEVLEDAMTDGAHIFHYSGHGGFEGLIGGQEGKGFLVLTDAIGGEQPFSAGSLALSLADRGVRLAMLGACESGRVDRVNAWSGIAPALLGAGIPAVVGMQFSVRDENAIAFSRVFYRELAAGHSIDEAVASGRQAIFIRAHDDPNERDWGAAVLYLRAQDDAILFPRTVLDTEALIQVIATTEHELEEGDLVTFRKTFQASLRQIDILSDYKELHDNLHDLQFAWFPLVRLKIEGLPDTKGAISDLRSYERDLRSVIGKLRDAVNNNNVPATESIWINTLEDARLALKQGIESAEAKMDLINIAVTKISQVLQIQPTYINGSLMRAIGALRLMDLKSTVQRVLDKLIVKDPTSDSVQRFREGIKALNKMDSELGELMKEHDIWQANEGKMPMIRLMLEHLAPFEILWQRLKSESSPLYNGKTEEWATDMQNDESAVDQALKDQSLPRVKESFNMFDKDATRRFWDVDKLIKQKCKELSKIRPDADPNL
ncbi:MAG: CHAT domain-containing protein [Pyrinomonadaceae bacterium]|nr:CHAT domain-containing protein [Pyrinomonadaceae bacterium]